MYDNLVGEFIGTLVLVWLGDSIGANLTLPQSKGSGSAGGSAWVTVNMGWCFALMMGVFAAWFFGAPEADLNPAVTLFKTLRGVYTFPHFIVTSIAEIAGGIAGAIVVWLTFMNQWDCDIPGAAKLGIFSTAPAVRNHPFNAFQEFLQTLILIMGIQFLAAKLAGDPTNLFLLPFMIGGLLYAIGAGIGGTTGYAMNPARDLGPRIAFAILPIPGKAGCDWGYGLTVPIIGPLAAGIASYAICAAVGF
jgi:glycerol uptake facilitator protein